MLRPIETAYKGYRFRSRLEARWAVFFDTLGLEYSYEPEGFALPSGNYLPDFWLPDVNLRTTAGGPGLWVEIKPVETSDERLEQLAVQSKIPVALVIGLPFIDDYGVVDEHGSGHYEYSGERGWDNCMVFIRCPACGRVKFEFSEGNYMNCENCGERDIEPSPLLSKAVLAARGARFEHGEHGT